MTAILLLLTSINLFAAAAGLGKEMVAETVSSSCCKHDRLPTAPVACHVVLGDVGSRTVTFSLNARIKVNNFNIQVSASLCMQ